MPDSNADRNPVDVLAEEFLARQRRGERPSLSEYVARYPELAGEIHELFPVLLDMEDARQAAAEPAPLAAAMSPHAPARLGDYRILREIGRGGMGVVYEAEQESLGRRVALKVLARAGLTPLQIRRFEREARAAAGLHHTHIVPVFGVGCEGGTHYYVMQYIPGQPLDEVLKELRRLRRRDHQPAGAAAGDGATGCGDHPSAADVARSLWSGTGLVRASDRGLEGRATPASTPEGCDPGSAATATLDDPAIPANAIASGSPRETAGPEPPSSSSSPSGSDVLSSSTELTGSGPRYARAVARIGGQVAEALEYAAGQGIIHRDIKPSNILLDLHGMAWVTDFGLAKVAGQEDLTHTGDLVGTLRYMAPERFRGQADGRSDVYALGLTLYELLALRPAYDESDRARLIRQVTEEDPPRLTRLEPAVPRDLATVVHKAMAREPAERYATAGALAADLTRFLEDRTILARRPSLLDRAAKAARRHRALVWSTGVSSTVLLVVVAAGLAVSNARISREVKEKTTALEQARRSAAESRAVLEFVENQVFAAARPEGQAGGLGPGVTLRQAVEAALPFVATSFKDQPLIEARLRITLGYSFLYLGEANRAVEQFQIARTLYTQHLGPDHPDTLRSMINLANSYHDLDRHAEAVKLREETLALAKAKLGLDHRDTLTSMGNLANSYDALGRHAEALKLNEETLALTKAKLGPDHPDTLANMHNLANSYFHLGRDTEAIKLHKETLALRRAKLGSDHPDTLASMHNLAFCYGHLGRDTEALKLHEETLALRKAKLGVDHPDTLRSMNNLAWLLATCPDPKLWDPRRAVEYAQKAVQGAPATSMNTLGVAQYRARDWKAAITTLQKAVELEGGPATSFNTFFLAMAHWQLGQKDEARKRYDQAVQWMEKNNPNDQELRRFRAEAAELLQIQDPPPSEAKKGPQ
jgi:serine/threonine protein kinase